METLEDKRVITRKLHNCRGCQQLYPKGTSMRYTTNVDSGFLHSYWCNRCVEFMKTLDPWDKMDGFAYGDLLNYDNYRQE